MEPQANGLEFPFADRVYYQPTWECTHKKFFTLRRNRRWCSDGLEIACDNGELGRVILALEAWTRKWWPIPPPLASTVLTWRKTSWWHALKNGLGMPYIAAKWSTRSRNLQGAAARLTWRLCCKQSHKTLRALSSSAVSRSLRLMECPV